MVEERGRVLWLFGLMVRLVVQMDRGKSFGVSGRCDYHDGLEME